ncbi:endo-alpha-N-acetylgalactosaminidase family protein [Streptomyces sp. NPDC046887]|uniref:endo-alpha-N-acetylgalactosaminidase family protein n=1 Tax=Streptomyces sp. NPDC046887 TaxID=3155472 RepID=UPI003403C331
MSPRTRAAGALAAALAVLLAPAGPAAAVSPVPAPPAGAGAVLPAAATVTLRSARLDVAVARDFPRVVSYTDRGTGARLLGSTRPVTEVVLNGTPHPVRVTNPIVRGASARYTLAFPDLPGVELDAALSVAGRAVTFRVTAVRDTEAFRVSTLDIPGHDLVSVGSTEPGAGTAFTRLDPDSTRTADVFGAVTDATPAEPAATGASYALVNTDRLAAAVESNSSYDKPAGPTGGDDARFWHQARRAEGGSVRVGVWSGQWTYRGAGAPEPERGADLPWAKVVVTPDANGDRKTDWQDGAVAFRTIGVRAPGSEATPDRVITHIPFNFASQATHPFLRTLDDVKRISLATDGLGQLAVLKGYGAEGHDSAHPDYGGNHNQRAGGLKDLNALLKAGKEWGAGFGVHVNATESYPEARAFDESLVDKTKPGWNWLNQSYYIDQRRDLNSGDLARRFRQLRQETDRNLNFLYIDVYYTHGWIADETMRAVRAQGWNVGTEWADKFERDSLWSHWANDLDYGGATNKGLNSRIIRFIRNGEKDVWNDHPVLGQTALEDFEGWTGENDFTAFTANVWEKNLPAKYLQGEKIVRWEEGAGDTDITFTGGVRGTVEDGRRTFYEHGRKVLDGDRYLLPWDGDGDGDGGGGGAASGGRKLYHYNKGGGESSWQVGAGSGPYAVYRLTDNGRVRTGTVRPDAEGRITLTAEARQAYVLYPGRAPAQSAPRWGEATPVADPGFNDARLAGWTTTGTVARDTDELGRNSALVSGSAPGGVRQKITGLRPGKRYTASAWIEVEPGKSRETRLTAGGRTVALERSPVVNTIGASDWHGTRMQRVKVGFTASARGTAELAVSTVGGGGGARVRVDDVRVVEGAPTQETKAEDFEAVDQGWGPFVKGGEGRANDPRTHLARRNAPYTQAGWNGKAVDDVLAGEWSLKSHEENVGLVYRTAPWTVPMRTGHRYRVEYGYQSSHPGAYEWVTGYDRVDGSSAETRRTPIPEQRSTTRFGETVDAACGDAFTGLRKRADAPEGADFVLDDFTVTDLGPSPATPACGTLALSAPTAALEPGRPHRVTAAYTNDEPSAVSGARAALTLPAGWTAEPAGPVELPTVQPGATATAAWQITPPADAAYRTYELRAEVRYGGGGGERTVSATAPVRTLPPPPTADAWASDLDWASGSSGWGPVERDRSNGGTAAGDGGPLRIGGTEYAKGLGTHAPATLRYYLGGRCTSFTAEVGVDDSQGSRGTVRFSVLADGERKVLSPTLTNAAPAWSLSADLTGAQYVDLVAEDSGDGNGNDHADWGDARFHCGG